MTFIIKIHVRPFTNHVIEEKKHFFFEDYFHKVRKLQDKYISIRNINMQICKMCYIHSRSLPFKGLNTIGRVIPSLGFMVFASTVARARARLLHT